MPEIRKDYATPTWVVFSAARSQRPGAFRNSKDATPKESCPFCEGHESMTPPEVLAYRDSGRRDGPGWSIRCVPNKFPALDPVGAVQEHRDGPFVSVDGVGAHEVIVESPDHDGRLATLDDGQIERVLRAYRERYHELASDHRVRYVQIFKNHGERAGASFSHPHSQIIAIPIVPLRILEELEGVRAHAADREGECLYCEILRRERAASRRVVAENEAFVALEPFAARFPFETWILPKVHARAFETLSDRDRGALARMLKDILGRMYRLLDDPAFNFYIHTAAPREPERTYHWHLEITPHLTEIAGFERGTGFYINPVVPEDAAAILKGEIRWSTRPESSPR
jgi:UDPglucose--hexose-1-phosphate uridylyltransferase